MNKLLKKSKYTCSFEASAVKLYDPSVQDRFEAKASLQNLKSFLPNDIDFERSYDLLGISFSAFVSSRANRNSQMISGADAKALAPLFLRRPINSDHNRNNILGVITNYGFSEFGTERPLNNDEVDELIAKEEPFNVNLGGVLWKIVDPDYIENLVAINSPDSNARKYACSWEVGFESFQIAEGSKNLSEARVIDDENEIQEIYQSLAHFDGNGINPKNNLPIYLLLGGIDDSLQGLGIGITKSPAGEVGPLLTNANLNNANIDKENDDMKIKAKENKADKIKADLTDDAKKDDLVINGEPDDEKEGALHDQEEGKSKEAAKIKEILDDGKDDPTKVVLNMKQDTEFAPTVSKIGDTIFSLDDVTLASLIEKHKQDGETNEEAKAKFSEALEKVLGELNLEKIFTNSVIASTTDKNDSLVKEKTTYMKLTKIDQITDEALTKGEVKASVLTEFLAGEIDRIGAEWKVKEDEKQEALTASTEKVSELGSKLAEVEAELTKLRDASVAREKAETFNTRLEGLASEYDFDDAEKEVVADRIKDLDSEGFEKYLKELSVFAKAKKKVDKKIEDKIDDKEDKTDKGKEVMASLKVDEDAIIIPNAADRQDDVKSRWAKAFGKGAVTVTK